MPKFSVVVPVYNAEKYIEKCIESVLRQSVTDFELILVDDGSPDASGSICDRYASHDKRVRVIHQPNGGHLAARMNGAKQAKGEYILFLDSDDYWLDGLLEKVNEKILQYNCEVLIFRLRKGDEPGHDFFKGEKGDITHAEYFTVNLAETGMNSLVIKAFARRLFENVDVSDFTSFRNSEDLILSVMLVKEAKGISYIPDVLYYYRPNTSSITNSYNKKVLKEFAVSRSLLWAEVERLGIDSEENKKVLYTGFLRRAADTALQISMSSMPDGQKITCYKDIVEMPMFSEAVKSVDLTVFGTAKQLRLKLLKMRRYKLLMVIDKLRKHF